MYNTFRGTMSIAPANNDQYTMDVGNAAYDRFKLISLFFDCAIRETASGRVVPFEQCEDYILCNINPNINIKITTPMVVTAVPAVGANSVATGFGLYRPQYLLFDDFVFNNLLEIQILIANYSLLNRTYYLSLGIKYEYLR